jgi:hypothetical protein
MQQKEQLTQLEVASVGEAIDHQLAKELIQSYQTTYPESFKAVLIGRNIIDQILAQPGCVGIRFIDAINEEGQKTLVYIGVDAANKAILESVVVERNGAIATVPAIVADRTAGGGSLIDDLITWLTGGSK